MIEEIRNESTIENIDTSLTEKLVGIFERNFKKSITVGFGVGIHMYTFAINNDHFYGIIGDFADGRYLTGVLKTSMPFILPYFGSSLGMWKARREAEKESP